MTANDNYEFRPPNWIFWLLAGVAILWFALILTSCTTERKAVKYFNAHGFQAAQYCADAFPVKDSTVYLPGATVIKQHTDTIPGEVVPCPAVQPGQQPAVVHCPPSIIIRDTVIRTDTVTHYEENTAKIAALQGRLAIATSNGNNAQNGRKKWRQWCLITWAILAVGIGGFTLAKFKII